MQNSPGWRCFFASSIVSTFLIVSAQSPQPQTYPQKTRTFHSVGDFARTSGYKVRIERQLDPQRELALRRTLTPLPTSELTVINVQTPSVTWVGTRQGAVRLTRDNQVREYFAGLRWLPDDHVTGIGVESNDASVTWIETPKGFARIEDVSMTLDDKSRAFVDRIQARHNRWGLTANSHLRVPGDLSTNQMVSSDNDGLWTAMYVVAECFRYRVTGAADARENARRGMQAIVRLESITGKPGFPARSFINVRAMRSQAMASGTTRRTRSGAGRATRARTRSSATTSSTRSISSSSPTNRRRRSSGRSSIASRTTSSTTTTS